MSEASRAEAPPRAQGRVSALPGAIAAVAITVYAVAFLLAESETEVAALVGLAVVAVLGAGRLRLLGALRASLAGHDRLMNLLAVLGMLAVVVIFREEHFTLLLVATVLVYTLACLGLNVQFGYAGQVNFAGASFLGIGCYTAAVLTQHTPVPPLLILPIGGLMAALIGGLLVIPVLRTRGHYMAVITIAFSLLFKTFLEVNDVLGGPQGLAVGSFTLLGWDFNENIVLGEGIELSFYVGYALGALALVIVGYSLVRRLERSWIGLNLDTIRLDETAAACFGLNVVWWKTVAFTFGNFLAGLAGAFYSMMLGFIAPNNFTFGDSLILVSIVLLGGIGSPWGVAVAAAIVVILPEKLQIIQEYRFLLYATTVILILLFRPDGLLPRQARRYFPDRTMGGGGS